MSRQILEKNNEIDKLIEEIKTLRFDKETLISYNNELTKTLEDVRLSIEAEESKLKSIQDELRVSQSNKNAVDMSVVQLRNDMASREAKLALDELELKKRYSDLLRQEASTLARLEGLEKKSKEVLDIQSLEHDKWVLHNTELEGTNRKLMDMNKDLLDRLHTIEESIKELEITKGNKIKEIHELTTQSSKSLEEINEELKSKRDVSIDVVNNIEMRERMLEEREANLVILVARLQSQIREFRPNLTIKV